MVVVADRLSLSLRKKSICSLLFQKLIHGIRILAQSLLKQLAKESIKALYCSRGSCLADCLGFFKRSKRTPETLCRVFFLDNFAPFGTALKTIRFPPTLSQKHLPPWKLLETVYIQCTPSAHHSFCVTTCTSQNDLLPAVCISIARLPVSQPSQVYSQPPKIPPVLVVNWHQIFFLLPYFFATISTFYTTSTILVRELQCNNICSLFAFFALCLGTGQAWKTQGVWNCEDIVHC